LAEVVRTGRRAGGKCRPLARVRKVVRWATVDHPINKGVCEHFPGTAKARARRYLGLVRDQHPLVLLACVAVLAGACRKDKDGSPPVVDILLPGEAFTLSVPDSLAIRVRVQDDRRVESLWIALASVDGVPVAPPITVGVGAASAVIDRHLAITDERLPSGTYRIIARASDGTNERSAFRAITVLGAPLRLRSVFIAPPPGTSPANILRIDSVGTLSTFTTVADLNGAVGHAGSQHLVLAGGASEPLRAIPAAPFANPWQVANQGTGTRPYFTGLRLDPLDGRLYFGTEDGFIRGYMGSGAQTFTARTMPGHRSMATALVGDRLVSEQVPDGQPDRRLAVFAHPSGDRLADFPLDVSVVHVDRLTNERVLLFGNRGGQGVLRDWHVPSGTSSELRVVTEGPIAAVQRLDANIWVIALPGRLVRFSHAGNSVSELAGGVAATALGYESVTNTLYTGAGSQLLLMDPVSGSIRNQYSLPQEVGFVMPLLNR